MVGVNGVGICRRAFCSNSNTTAPEISKTMISASTRANMWSTKSRKLRPQCYSTKGLGKRNISNKISYRSLDCGWHRNWIRSWKIMRKLTIWINSRLLSSEKVSSRYPKRPKKIDFSNDFTPEWVTNFPSSKNQNTNSQLWSIKYDKFSNLNIFTILIDRLPTGHQNPAKKA